MGISHDIINLLGGFLRVVGLSALFADKHLDFPDDDDLIPRPCDELTLSFFQITPAEGATIGNQSGNLLFL